MLEKIGSLPSSWDAGEGEGEEGRFDGKDGCHLGHNMNAPRGPNQTLQYAGEGQYAITKSRGYTRTSLPILSARFPSFLASCRECGPRSRMSIPSAGGGHGSW